MTYKMHKDKSKIIDYVEVRGQGTINADFIVGYGDGSVEEFYSIDQEYPRSVEDDSSIEGKRPKFAKLLMTYWSRAAFEFDPDDTGKNYTKIFGPALLRNK